MFNTDHLRYELDWPSQEWSSGDVDCLACICMRSGTGLLANEIHAALPFKVQPIALGLQSSLGERIQEKYALSWS